jgi:hypothetical protein
MIPIDDSNVSNAETQSWLLSLFSSYMAPLNFSEWTALILCFSFSITMLHLLFLAPCPRSHFHTIVSGPTFLYFFSNISFLYFFSQIIEIVLSCLLDNVSTTELSLNSVSCEVLFSDLLKQKLCGINSTATGLVVTHNYKKACPSCFFFIQISQYPVKLS